MLRRAVDQSPPLLSRTIIGQTALNESVSRSYSEAILTTVANISPCDSDDTITSSPMLKIPVYFTVYAIFSPYPPARVLPTVTR